MVTDLSQLKAEVNFDEDTHIYETGQFILENGDNSKYACKLISGTAKVLRAGDVVATISAGEYFGAIAALTGNKRTATVVASERCIVEKISKHKFKLMIQTKPELLDHLI